MQPTRTHNSQPTTHNLLLLIDPPQDGLTNMAVDEVLLGMAAAGELGPVLRFYQWSPATLSLGYFQHYAERAEHPASTVCDVVRRASGGGAILHDRELTYSLVLPAGHPLAVRAEPLYRAVHQTLIDVLGESSGSTGGSPSPKLDVRFWDEVRPTSSSADGSAGVSPSQESFACGDTPKEQDPFLNSKPLSLAEPFLCFQRRSPGDLVLRASGETATEPAVWHKILGSAQRRRHGAVLQHGSLLWERSSFAPELPGVSDLAGTDFARMSYAELIAAWSGKLAVVLGFELSLAGQSVAWTREPWLGLAREKFHEPGWLHSR